MLWRGVCNRGTVTNISRNVKQGGALDDVLITGPSKLRRRAVVLLFVIIAQKSCHVVDVMHVLRRVTEMLVMCDGGFEHMVHVMHVMHSTE